MMVVIFTQGLYYMYFAETIAIFMVEAAVAIYVLAKSSHTVLDGSVILTFYPLAIVVVYFLYTVGLG